MENLNTIESMSHIKNFSFKIHTETAQKISSLANCLEDMTEEVPKLLETIKDVLEGENYKASISLNQQKLFNLINLSSVIIDQCKKIKKDSIKYLNYIDVAETLREKKQIGAN